MLTLLLAAALGAAPPTHSPVAIERTGGPLQVRVVAVLPAEAAEKLPAGELKQDQGERALTFALVDADTGKAGDAMFGRYEHKGGRLVFTPRHSLLAGERYRATLTLGQRPA